jgi:uncharacterized membrane protein (UPF0127 family)
LWVGVVFAFLGACGAQADSSTPVTFDTAVSTSPVTTSPVTASPVTTSPVTTSPVTTGPVANDLAGFPRFDMVVAGEPWTVAVADTPQLRSQGLMGVTELVGVDGMLFVFVGETVTDPVHVGFYMLNTLIPLDIWYFDYDGKLVDMLTMEPCEAAPCRTYLASDPFHYALETEVGRIDPTGVVEMEFYGFED